MPSLTEHSSKSVTKLIYIGDSKSGKTGSLVSLVKAGYKLRILDMDNLLDTLKYFVMKECPQNAKNVEYITYRDKRKASASGPVLDGKPMAYVNALKALDNWPGLGPPSEWGPDCILIIDSLSRLCDAAYDFHEVIAQAQGGRHDGRMVYFSAQKSVEDVLANLSAESFNTNVIVICHIMYIDQPDGTVKGYPQSVGKALSPKIPSYFPSAILATNKGGKRVIRTTSTPLLDLANPAPFAMSTELPLETGLADFFAVLRDPPKVEMKLRKI
jgi:hypothetical protein